MKKSVKIGLLFILFSFFSFFVCHLKVEALDYTIDDYDYTSENYDYTIENYDINIIVNEDNSFDIEEVITTNFNVEKHGIFRTIPLKNTVVREDGTISTTRAKISNVKVDHNYETSRNGNEYEIKIGSADYTLIGEQTYKISYTYSLGKDPLKDKDELYYNIIGTEWDTIIKNVNFKITMPKDFDQEKLGFSSGSYGSTTNNVSYQVIDNTIVGSLYETLSPYEALTIRLELEEGYFIVPINNTRYLMFIVPFIFLVISIFIWYKYGKDDEVVETVEFYPPEDFNSLEIGYLYKGKAGGEDVVSLLIYLADKGYIKISEKEEESLFLKNKTFSITKLKEYDGNNTDERKFFDGLFKNKEIVTESDLTNRFYVTINEVLRSINSKRNHNKIFEKKSSGKKLFIILGMLISLLLIILIPTLEYGPGDEAFAMIMALLIYTPFYAVGIFTDMSAIFRIFWLGFTTLHASIMLIALPIKDIFLTESIYLYGLIFGILCIIGMGICLKYLPKRTPYGNEILGRIRGFKNFLETAEKSKLETLVSQDPTYFYHILPYTYVLGVSDKWIKKFETIAFESPEWYDSPSNSNFTVSSFGNSINRTMTSAKSSMISSPSSSGGSSSGGYSGGSSGGGSSGGGSGGGGGGSW